MPKMEPTFTVEAPADEVWAFLTDMERVGSCVPGCEVHEVDAQTFAWEMTAKMGPISKTFKFTTQATTQDDVNHIAEFAGGGDGLEIAGRCRLDPVSARETHITFELDINGTGGVATIVNNLIKMKIGEYEAAFVECVRGSLEGHD